jgi:hypothetical protein
LSLIFGISTCSSHNPGSAYFFTNAFIFDI